MQEDPIGQAMLPNRKERRRLAAQTKRPAWPTCACCPPTPREDDLIERPDGSVRSAG
jgi:hypothetical protein